MAGAVSPPPLAGAPPFAPWAALPSRRVILALEQKTHPRWGKGGMQKNWITLGFLCKRSPNSKYYPGEFSEYAIQFAPPSEFATQFTTLSEHTTKDTNCFILCHSISSKSHVVARCSSSVLPPQTSSSFPTPAACTVAPEQGSSITLRSERRRASAAACSCVDATVEVCRRWGGRASVCARRSLVGVGKEELAAMCEGEACRCGEEELAGVER